MSMYLVKEPLGLSEEAGDLLLYSDSFLHDESEPISPSEVEKINTLLGKKVIKLRKFLRDVVMTRKEAATAIEGWIALQQDKHVSK